MKVLFSFFIIFSVFAEQCIEKPIVNDPFQDAIRNILQKMEEGNFSASQNDIAMASCKGEIPDLINMKEYNDLLEIGDRVESKTISGALFKNETKEMLHIFDILAMKRKLSGEGFLSENQTDYSYLTKGDCKKVRCALSKLFGEEYAENAIYLLSKYELNISPVGLEGDSTKAFSKKELLSVHQSIVDLPESMFPIEKAKSLRRSKEDRGGDIANATIIFFDGFGRYDHHHRTGICTHEFAHTFSNLGKLDESPEWLRISGWEDHGGEWKKVNDEEDNFISLYSRANPGEDFAESVVAYRYNPNGLKSISIDKYNFIKELVFKGREYIDIDASSKFCKGQTDFEYSLGIQVSKLSKNDNILGEKIFFDQSISGCSEELINELIEEKKNDYKSCISKILRNKITLNHWDKLKSNFNYPDKAKELISKNFYDINVELDKKKLEKVHRNIEKKIKKIKSNSMKNILLSLNYKRERTQAKTVDSFCKEEIVKYSYQHFNEASVMLQKGYLYASRKKIEEKVYSICKNTFKTIDDFKKKVKLSDIL